MRRVCWGVIYGFTISARKLSDETGGVYISGLAWQRGGFRLILPMKPRVKLAESEEPDFVPPWGTEAEAKKVIRKLDASPAGAVYAFKVCDIRASVEAGGVGSSRVKYFRGVDGWQVPDAR